MKKRNLFQSSAAILCAVTIIVVVTFSGMLPAFASFNSQSSGRTPIPVATTSPQAPHGWEITTTSGKSEIDLAKHLKSIGAKEYGAYWCPHCYEQKQLFGKEAFKQLNYVECDPKGSNPQPQACSDAGIEGYPTWTIKGEKYTGTQLLDDLAKISGYRGATSFKYMMPGR